MRFYWRYLLFCISTGLLCSCMVGPDFVRPTTKETLEYTDKPLKKAGNQHFKLHKKLTHPWWKEFHSSELDKLMLQGIKNNYSLVVMNENLAQSRELVTAATGQLWPQVGLTSSIGAQKYGVAFFGPTNIHIPSFTYYELGPTVNYIADVFGGTRRTIEKQQALAMYQQDELNAAFLTVTGNIASTYLTIASINAQIMTTKDIIADDQKNVNLVKKAFDFGSTAKTEVLIAESQLTNDKTLLPPLYQQLKVAESALSVLLGSAPANILFPKFTLDEVRLPKELPMSLPSELLHKRPDILASEAMLHAASADVGIATANLYPNITLSGTSLQQALSPAHLFAPGATAWSLLGNLTTPIFTGGTLRAQRRAAIHAYQSACANYQQVVLKAFGQVSDVLYALKHDAEEMTLQRQAVGTAKESLTLARLSFDAGNVGVLQVLDAQRLYAQSRLGYVRAEVQRYQDTIQLYLVLGGGLFPG